MKQVLILVRGHMSSGKSRLTEKLIKDLDLNINRINADLIRDFLISNLKFYSNINYSYPTEQTFSLNKITKPFKLSIIKELIDQKQSLIIDVGALTKESRKENLAYAKENKYLTIIINCELEEKVLLERLKIREKENPGHKWVSFYNDISKKRFEEISDDEADYILTYNQNNYEEIKNKLEKIIL